MESKLDFWTMDIPVKCKDKEQALKYIGNLIDCFRYITNKHKDYMIQAVIGVSNLNGKLVLDVYNQQTGKVGKPKRIKNICSDNIINLCCGELEKEWHIHILVLSKPKEMVRRLVKDYIDKNWCHTEEKAYKKDADVDLMFYIANQSEEIRYYGAGDKRFKYSLKQLYNEYVRVCTELRKNKYYINEEDVKVRKVVESKYNEMLKYFRGITEERQRELESEHKKRVRVRKIKERYDEINNKVMKNNYVKDYYEDFI